MTITGVVPRRPAPRLHFGDYVRAARREMHLGQVEFAVLIGVKRVTLGAWESGKNTPGDIPATAEMLEERTGFSRAWFLGWGDAPSPRGPGATMGGGKNDDSFHGKLWSHTPGGIRPLTSPTRGGRPAKVA